jgi:CHAD domain-containing protein
MSALDDRRYSELLSHYQSYLSAAETTSTRNVPSISSFAQNYIPERIRLILKAGRQIDRKSKAKELHRLRIRIKRLRYQLELLAEPYGGPLQKASKRLRKLQDTLGAHQDACLAQSVLKDYRHQLRAKSDKSCFAELMTFEADRAAVLRKRFHRDWLKFDYHAGALKRVF